MLPRPANSTHLVTVVDCRHHLPEEVPSFLFSKSLALADVVIQVSFAGVLHHNDNLAAVFKHWMDREVKGYHKNSQGQTIMMVNLWFYLLPQPAVSSSQALECGRSLTISVTFTTRATLVCSLCWRDIHFQKMLH